MSEGVDVKPQKTWVGRLLKLSAVLAVFIFIALTILSNLGGANDSYKEALEEFIAGATGYDAHIGVLNNVSFYPDISFDFNTLELRDVKMDASPSIIAERVFVVSGFWDVMKRSGKVKRFHVQGLDAKAGTMLAQPLYLEDVQIEPSADQGAVLTGNGQIGDRQSHFSIRLSQFKNGAYGISAEHPLHVKIGDATLNAVFKNKNNQSVFKDLNINLKNQKVLAGTIFLDRNIRTDLTVSEYGSDIQSDVRLDFSQHPAQVKGSFESINFYTKDFQSDARLIDFKNYMLDVFFEDDDMQWRLWNIDFKFKAQNIFHADNTLEAQSVDINVENQTVVLQPPQNILNELIDFKALMAKSEK